MSSSLSSVPRRQARPPRALRHRLAALIGVTALLATGATAGMTADVATAPAATAAQCSSSNFTDVPRGSSSAYGAVTWMYCNGITEGYNDGTFGVGQYIARAEVAAFLYRQVTPKHPVNGAVYFTDVPGTGKYYSEPAAWMAQAGLAKGFADQSFGVSRNITRGELAAFIYRLSGSSQNGPDRSPFKDMGWSTGFYHEASWLQKYGIAGGYTDGTFRPDQPITRGEVAIMLKNAHRYIAAKGDVTSPVVAPLPNQVGNPSTASPAWTAKAVQWAATKAADKRAKYQWAGNGPWAFDCSGFTVAAFAAAGKSLPRTAASQHGAASSYVPLAQAKPGDLVYWSNNGKSSGVYHVAVVLEGGRIAHARNEKEGVSVTSINYSPWNMLSKAGRYY